MPLVMRQTLTPSPLIRGKETVNKLILTFLYRFYTERHSLEICYHLFSISKGKMTQQSLIILINIIINYCLLSFLILKNRSFESVYYLLKYRIVEYKFLPVNK